MVYLLGTAVLCVLLAFILATWKALTSPWVLSGLILVLTVRLGYLLLRPRKSTSGLTGKRGALRVVPAAPAPWQTNQAG